MTAAAPMAGGGMVEELFGSVLGGMVVGRGGGEGVERGAGSVSLRWKRGDTRGGREVVVMTGTVRMTPDGTTVRVTGGITHTRAMQCGRGRGGERGKPGAGMSLHAAGADIRTPGRTFHETVRNFRGGTG